MYETGYLGRTRICLKCVKYVWKSLITKYIDVVKISKANVDLKKKKTFFGKRAYHIPTLKNLACFIVCRPYDCK